MPIGDSLLFWWLKLNKLSQGFFFSFLEATSICCQLLGFDLYDLLKQARSRWMVPAEVLFILQYHDGDMIKNRVPQQPTSGYVIVYDKKITPFRRDGCNWCKKPNKNTVNEGHEKLKVDGVAVIDCYYAKREDNHDFMRRSYWMLDGAKKHIVLVHYRDIIEGKTNTESIVKFSAGQSCTFTQSYVHDQFATCHSQVFKEQHATLQHGRDDGIVSRLADQFAGQEIAPQEAENFGGISLEMTPMPDCHRMLLHRDQVQMPQLGTCSSLPTIPQPKFEIRALSPDWCYADEGAKVVIIGSFHCDPSEYAWALFGGSKVPIEIMQDGVICCHAPTNSPGKVTFCITSANGELYSEVKHFEYRNKYNRLQQYENRNTGEVKLQVKFEQMLFSDSSSEKVESSSNFQEQLLKKYLLQWLLAQSWYGDGTLSINDKEIIHVVGGLGYEWALEPLLNFGVGVDFQDANGWTALHWAARFGREQMVAALIANGASADASTNPTEEYRTGQMPADIAYANGHKEIAGYLFEKALNSD